MTYHVARRGLGSVPSQQYGQIITKDGWSYQITPDDVLWAARASQCEGGGEDSHKATLWAWTQRFALPSFRRNYGSLASLIRAHSQPVNPIWARGGSKCGPGGQYAGNDRYCSESQLANRASCAGRPWESISSGIRDNAVKWATARLPNPIPRGVDFASSSIGTQSGDIEVARYRSPGAAHYNVFYSEPASRERPDDFTQIQFEGHTSGISAGLPSWAPWLIAAGAATVVVGGAAAIAFTRRR